MSTIPQQLARRRRAELVSTTGAGVLGAGVGLLFARTLSQYTLPILLIGLFCHGWGMYEKHLVDLHQGERLPRWVDWVYWMCWIMLAGLLVFIFGRSF